MKRIIPIVLATTLVWSCDNNGAGPGDGALTNVQVSFATQSNQQPAFHVMSAERLDTTVVGTDTLILSLCPDWAVGGVGSRVRPTQTDAAARLRRL